MRQFAVQILLSPVSLKQSLRDTPKAGSNGVNPSQPEADVVPTDAVLVHQFQVIDSTFLRSRTHSVDRTAALGPRALDLFVGKPLATTVTHSLPNRCLIRRRDARKGPEAIIDLLTNMSWAMATLRGRTPS